MGETVTIVASNILGAVITAVLIIGAFQGRLTRIETRVETLWRIFEQRADHPRTGGPFARLE